jgi:hypothetical protein
VLEDRGRAISLFFLAPFELLAERGGVSGQRVKGGLSFC